MSARRHLVLLVCGLYFGAAALADEEQVPDGEFLEYLGMWEETDEEWLLHNEMQAADLDERSDPAPDGEESTENEDES